MFELEDELQKSKTEYEKDVKEANEKMKNYKLLYQDFMKFIFDFLISKNILAQEKLEMTIASVGEYDLLVVVARSDFGYTSVNRIDTVKLMKKRRFFKSKCVCWIQYVQNEAGRVKDRKFCSLYISQEQYKDHIANDLRCSDNILEYEHVFKDMYEELKQQSVEVFKGRSKEALEKTARINLNLEFN